MKPMIRGNICLNAHPEGCAAMVDGWIARAKAASSSMTAAAEAAGKALPRATLVLGCSTGYGLASRITAAFGCGAATVGVSLEREPSDRKPGTPGWYDNRAFDAACARDGLFSATIDADAFADETRAAVVALARERGLRFDQVVYSLASPVRVDPATGVMHRSALKPIGEPFTGRSFDVVDGRMSEVTIQPATDDEVEATVKVMGGEDWELWIGALSEAGVLAPGCVTLAYSYVGPSHTSAIYRGGSIGRAKEHLERTAKSIAGRLAASGGAAYVAVNKAVVTRASAVIPVVALYVAALFKTMKELGLHEDCQDQMLRLYRDRLLAPGAVPTDDEGRIRLDDLEMRADVQEATARRFASASEDKLAETVDLDGFRHDFLEAHGFDVPGVDYDADVAFR
ncbi:MAG: trans-2-enoyl-CoA reductase family protein [Spirochaetaceae bacterium]|nr:trans-2-enoyl-CoA reductase family protein [Spirochaetaceae bacterium]